MLSILIAMPVEIMCLRVQSGDEFTVRGVGLCTYFFFSDAEVMAVGVDSMQGNLRTVFFSKRIREWWIR